MRAFTLESHGCLSTACASAVPFRPECCCNQRSASTISVGLAAAARICAISASGYKRDRCDELVQFLR